MRSDAPQQEGAAPTQSRAAERDTKRRIVKVSGPRRVMQNPEVLKNFDITKHAELVKNLEQIKEELENEKLNAWDRLRMKFHGRVLISKSSSTKIKVLTDIYPYSTECIKVSERLNKYLIFLNAQYT